MIIVDTKTSRLSWCFPHPTNPLTGALGEYMFGAPKSTRPRNFGLNESPTPPFATLLLGVLSPKTLVTLEINSFTRLLRVHYEQSLSPKYCSARWIEEAANPRAARNVGAEERKKKLKKETAEVRLIFVIAAVYSPLIDSPRTLKNNVISRESPLASFKNHL